MARTAEDLPLGNQWSCFGGRYQNGPNERIPTDLCPAAQTYRNLPQSAPGFAGTDGAPGKFAEIGKKLILFPNAAKVDRQFPP